MSRKKEKKPEEATDSAAWLATFSDLNFLMITFFVLLLSMSSMDQRRFSDMLGDNISPSEEMLRPEPPMGRSPLPAIYPARGTWVGDRRELPVDPEPGSAGRHATEGTGSLPQELTSPIPDPEGTERDEVLRRAMARVPNLVTVEAITDDEIRLAVEDSLFFENDEYRPSPQATEVLRSIGELAQDIGGQLMVQAHHGDWHLAAKRSSTVAMLMAQRHIPGERVSADVISGSQEILNFSITRTISRTEPDTEEQE